MKDMDLRKRSKKKYMKLEDNWGEDEEPEDVGVGEEEVIVTDVPNPKRPSYKGTIMTVITDYLPTVSQGGILAGNQGTRFPRNLQTHTKFLQHFTLFWRKFDFKVCISCQMKKFFLSHLTCRKYFFVTGRNFLALHVIYFHRKKFIVKERIFYQGH